MVKRFKQLCHFIYSFYYIVADFEGVLPFLSENSYFTKHLYISFHFLCLVNMKKTKGAKTMKTNKTNTKLVGGFVKPFWDIYEQLKDFSCNPDDNETIELELLVYEPDRYDAVLDIERVGKNLTVLTKIYAYYENENIQLKIRKVRKSEDDRYIKEIEYNVNIDTHFYNDIKFTKSLNTIKVTINNVVTYKI